MTEKSYGGDDGVRNHKGRVIRNKSSPDNDSKKKLDKKTESGKNSSAGYSSEAESYKKAGEIAKEIRIFARELIKPGMLLVDIAREIHKKIEELGAVPAFPVNLSIDDIAAHYHPVLEDKTLASGLLKVDLGISVKGFIADSAFSMDLTEDKRHKKLIESAEKALENALEILDKNPELDEIGSVIQKTIENSGFSPIINLSGHSLDKYNIHSGITIPNYKNGNKAVLPEGAYAIEPFSTTGTGRIYEGPPGNIYSITSPKNTRSPSARKILEYVWGKYQTLPFSLRELQEKFGNVSRIAIKEMEQQGILHSYPQLIEKSRKPVAQAEHTFVKTKEGEIIVTTRE